MQTDGRNLLVFFPASSAVIPFVDAVLQTKELFLLRLIAPNTTKPQVQVIMETADSKTVLVLCIQVASFTFNYLLQTELFIVQLQRQLSYCKAMKYAVFNLKILRNHSARTAITVFYHKSVVPIKILQLSINLQVDLDDVCVSLPVSREASQKTVSLSTIFSLTRSLQKSLCFIWCLFQRDFSLQLAFLLSLFSFLFLFTYFAYLFFAPPFSPPLIHLTDVFLLSSYHTDCQMACYHCKSYYQNSSNTLTFVFCKNLCKKREEKVFMF